MATICVNPEESLAELIHQKNVLLRKINLLNTGKEWSNEYCALDIELQKVNVKIYNLERAAKTPGQCIRIM